MRCKSTKNLPHSERNREDIVRRIDADTQVHLDEMNKSVAASKDKVISDLLEMVVQDVKPELHRNLRLG